MALPALEPDPAPQPAERDPSLRASIRDGMGHAVMLGTGESYLGPFGIFLHASTLQVGLLSTLPQLVLAIFQMWSVWIGERVQSRRKALELAVSINATTWFLFAALALYAPRSSESAWMLIGLAVLYFASGGCAAPFWNSLINDLVPRERRGHFFGRRNKFNGLCTFLGLLIGGKALWMFEQAGHANRGFACLFLVAAAARYYSARWLRQHEDPPVHHQHEHRFSLWQFLARAPWSNFARFVFFSAAINLGVAFSAPYYALYMLRDLQFSYSQFAVICSTVMITQFLTMQYWGTLTDRFGNKQILSFCGRGVSMSPLLWLISSDFHYLLLVQLYSGIVWAGYNLATANFIFDAVSPPKVARCGAYHSFINSLTFLVGSLLGAYTAGHAADFLSYWDLTITSPLLIVFFISGLIRLSAAYTFLPRFSEVRPVERIRDRDLIMAIVNVRPLIGATFNVTASVIKRRQLPTPSGTRQKRS